MLSKKTQYAFRALTHLAENYGKGPVLISHISVEKNIPLKFLENILNELKKADLLESKKGKGGGYSLKISPKKISLATVIRVINGPIALLPCVSLNFYEKCADCDEEHCGMRKLMTITRDATLKILEKKTLNDVVLAGV
ncbi:MAG: Rrf2 family transcriptional regulator [Bacteroidota bacterium]|nr:Rrf2 family transcriptional regulator [Bacteroidota bacterium]MDQ6889897.1 Rrf2 family transcriptional regulator [Bacteroidota bacterium]